MQLPDFLKGPAGLVRGSAELLAESVASISATVAREAPALRGPAIDVLTQLAGGLRESAEAVQTKVAKIDAPTGDVDVRESLGTDPTLTDHQRRVLLNIYAAFQEENSAASRTTT